jgi:hypothetical protein
MPKLKNKTLAITRSEQDAKEFLQLVRAQEKALLLRVHESTGSKYSV